MVLPIYLYGNAVLRKVAEPISADYPNLQTFIADMRETLKKCGSGIGLAAPQVGVSIRLFVIDLSIIEDEEHPEYKDFNRVFINPEIVDAYGEDISMEEGCLSIPGVGENVVRKNKVLLHYYDENFVEHKEEFTDYIARVVQHEYDHLDGHVFTDRVSLLRKQFIKSKLMSISKGKAHCGYKIKKA